MQELCGYGHKPFLATCRATMKSYIKWSSIINVRALHGHVIVVSECLLRQRLLGKVCVINEVGEAARSGSWRGVRITIMYDGKRPNLICNL